MIRALILKLKLIFIPTQENNYRPKFLESRVLICCLVVLFILKLISASFFIYFPKSAFFSDISKVVLFELLNKDRQAAGLQPLKENKILDKAAFLKAQDMLNKDYFSHQSPEGVSPWYWLKMVGYNYNLAGENLAIGFLDSSEVQEAWLASPSHKANILNPDYKDVGIAIARGEFQKNETTVVVQFFGTPQQSVSGPKVETKGQIKELSKEEAVPEKKEVEKETLSAKFDSVTKEVVPALKETQQKATFNFLSFFASDYYDILQIVIYGFLGLIIFSLIINIFVKLHIQHIDLILKALGFIAVLVLFILFDKGMIIKLIPHNFNIY